MGSAHDYINLSAGGSSCIHSDKRLSTHLHKQETRNGRVSTNVQGKELHSPANLQSQQPS